MFFEPPSSPVLIRSGKGGPGTIAVFVIFDDNMTVLNNKYFFENFFNFVMNCQLFVSLFLDFLGP